MGTPKSRRSSSGQRLLYRRANAHYIICGLDSLPRNSIMNVAESIRAKLTAAFAPAALEIKDESHLHAGHAGHRPGVSTHFRVAIVADVFAGKSRVERQRLIYASLGELMGNPIHALALSAKAPGE
jgi:BolA protein